jgi:aspartate-semialdehyde dehydrogenase
MRIAIVGATGLVGGVMRDVISSMQLPHDELLMVASPRSVGKVITHQGQDYTVVGMQEAVDLQPDIAIFSAGGSTSLEWAPKFAAAGTTVIDNSSAWRMDPTKPLVVPEINATALTSRDKIIANPNCSTIQMVMALAPLHRAYGIKRLVISTYQSYTGTGKSAVDQYDAERAGKELDYSQTAYQHPIFANCIPQCDVFLDNDYTKEEMKLVHETRKILGDEKIAITATAVRVPVHGGHSESVNVELEQAFDVEEVKTLLAATPGVTVLDDPSSATYPMPLDAHQKDDVFVGRIRRDTSLDQGLNMWIVSDNLRKGAATNAVQIAQFLMDHDLLKK